jgi:ABC-type transport system involved in cytochrome bd biosynthesis fused ATPase/permease subunit
LNSEHNENNDSEWIQVKVKNKKKEPPSNLNIKEEKEIIVNKQFNDEYNNSNVEIVKNLIERNKKSLIVLRGCSGSGKSTLAK